MQGVGKEEDECHDGGRGEDLVALVGSMGPGPMVELMGDVYVILWIGSRGHLSQGRHRDLTGGQGADEGDVDPPVESERLEDGLDGLADASGDRVIHGVGRHGYVVAGVDAGLREFGVGTHREGRQRPDDDGRQHDDGASLMKEGLGGLPHRDAH